LIRRCAAIPPRPIEVAVSSRRNDEEWQDIDRIETVLYISAIIMAFAKLYMTFVNPGKEREMIILVSIVVGIGVAVAMHVMFGDKKKDGQRQSKEGKEK